MMHQVCQGDAHIDEVAPGHYRLRISSDGTRYCNAQLDDYHHLPRRHLASEIGTHLIAIGRKQGAIQRKARKQAARPGDGDNIRTHRRCGRAFNAAPECGESHARFSAEFELAIQHGIQPLLSHDQHDHLGILQAGLKTQAAAHQIVKGGG